VPGRSSWRGLVLHAQHGVVHIALALGETAVHRDAPGEVAGVAAVLTAEVHQDHIAVVAHLVVGDVVQHAGVVAAGDDGRVGMPARAVAQELMRDLRLDLVLLHTGLHEAAHALEGLAGDGDRALHLRHFLRCLALRMRCMIGALRFTLCSG
jgi:hypothetical protein